MDNINAVIIHSEHCPFYLKPNIMQILDTFKNCTLYVISDDVCAHLQNELNICFIPLKSFSQNVPPYNYLHFSINEEKYEKFCIDRWIILNTFMQEYNLDRIIYFDSDVFVISPKILDIFYDTSCDIVCDGDLVTMPCVISWKKNILNSFVEYIYDLYALPYDKCVNCLQNISDRVFQNTLHISDMFLIGDFLDDWSRVRMAINDDQTINTLNYKQKRIRFGEKMIDTNIYLNKNYDFLEKYIVYDNDEYYVSNNLIMYIHFQGINKRHYNYTTKLLKDKKTFMLKKIPETDIYDSDKIADYYVKFLYDIKN